ncbi:MAG: CHAD domain-containing protein [Saprospiraceae bacterium]|nr:CHAD domain-containing protein [Saprospiraceae bacterium]
MKDPSDIHAGIHQARRHIKILRATLRLIQFELSPDIYRYENHFYRDIARELSSVRDLTAMMETIEDLIEIDSQGKIKHTYIKLKNHILTERQDYIQSHHNLLAKVHKSLADHQILTQDIAWSTHLKRNLLRSLQLSYDRAAKRWQISLQNPSPEHNHEWRKKSKYLRYQFLILQNAWLPIFKAWEKETHHLTDLLGQANNLVILEKHLEKSPLFENHLELIQDVIHGQESKLIESAKDLGTKLFAEKTDAFTRRINVYLSEWAALK